MKRDKRPDSAIDDAKQAALEGGFRIVEMVHSEELEFDFAVERDGVTSLVRVRRLKHARFRIVHIQRSCVREIRELRECVLFRGSERELWARGPPRAFHRYRVLPETLEELGNPGVPPAPAGAADQQQTGPVPWHERPIEKYSGEVREVPYVRESPFKRERREAMFRGYAKYRAEQKERENLPGNPGDSAADVGSGPGNPEPGTKHREPVTGDPGPGTGEPGGSVVDQA
jgi:hypothetical protein